MNLITRSLTSRHFRIAAGVLLFLSLILASLDKNLLLGVLAYLPLFIMGWLILLWIRRTVSANQRIFNLALIAAFIRLFIGVGLILLLPIFGYKDSEEHQSGYIFHDSYVRDQQAWELATSEAAISSAFSGSFTGDQYGGSLALSTFIYRYLSPDAHRQALPFVVNAVAIASGILLLWGAVKTWFGEKIAWLSAVIFAFFPDAVLLGSSQMREPVVMAGVAMSLYGLANIRPKSFGWIGWLVASGVILFAFQPPIALVSFIILLGFWLFNPQRERPWILLIVLSGVLIVGLFLVITVWASLPSLQEAGPFSVIITWLQNNFQFQSHVTERASGMIQKLLDTVGESWTWLVILLYGIAQPVLPAVFGDPDAAWFIRIITFLRAVGWYALAPLLLYAILSALRDREEPRRAQIVWLNLVTWIWIIIAALSAGGDQWDNPRYRTILLAWQALTASWAWWWAKDHQDGWLRRLLTLEVIFILMFTIWYVGRYYVPFLHFDIWIMMAATILLSGLALFGEWVWDRRKQKIYPP
jgi:hypothetical protein